MFEMRATRTAAGSRTAPRRHIVHDEREHGARGHEERDQLDFRATAVFIQTARDPVDDAGDFQTMRDDEQADQRDHHRAAEAGYNFGRRDQSTEGDHQQHDNRD